MKRNLIITFILALFCLAGNAQTVEPRNGLRINISVGPFTASDSTGEFSGLIGAVGAGDYIVDSIKANDILTDLNHALYRIDSVAVQVANSTVRLWVTDLEHSVSVAPQTGYGSVFRPTDNLGLELMVQNGSLYTTEYHEAAGLTRNFILIDEEIEALRNDTLSVGEVTPSNSTTIGIDLASAREGIYQIDLTSASTGSTVTFTASNPSVGVFTFHWQNADAGGHDVNFPATFLDQAGDAWDSGSTYSISADFFMTCYYDGANFYCK